MRSLEDSFQSSQLLRRESSSAPPRPSVRRCRGTLVAFFQLYDKLSGGKSENLIGSSKMPLAIKKRNAVGKEKGGGRDTAQTQLFLNDSTVLEHSLKRCNANSMTGNT